MSVKDFLHFSSHLKWLFLLVIIILIGYAFIAPSENQISILGTIIFLTGIHMGLDSLSDINKMSEKEKKNFESDHFVRIQRRIILTSIAILVLTSMLFLSLRFIFPSRPIFNDLFELGLDCWAMILGLLCLLKSVYDKTDFVKSQIN